MSSQIKCDSPIRTSVDEAEEAARELKAKGLSDDKAEKLRSLVDDKVQFVHTQIAATAGGEYEETWLQVSEKDPRIVAAGKEFIATEGITTENDLVAAIHDFVEKHTVLAITRGFFRSISIDGDDWFKETVDLSRRYVKQEAVDILAAFHNTNPENILRTFMNLQRASEKTMV